MAPPPPEPNPTDRPENPPNPQPGPGPESAWSRRGRWLTHHPFPVTGLNITVWAVVGLLVLLTAVGALTGKAANKTAANFAPPTSTIAVTGSPAASLPSAVASLPRPVAPSPHLTIAAAAPVALTPVPPDPTGGITVNAAGAVLPDSARTPGAINASVTQATIARTICVSGWTATVRPSSSVTTSLKMRQLASGYNYQGDSATGDYEEDHLISLELGGAPSAEANLWPEPYHAPDGARVKDAVENKLHTLVCGGTITLATAQHAIATNWWIAYETYVGTAAPSIYSAPPVLAPTQPVTPAQPASALAPPGGATALCNDGSYSYASHHRGACSRHGGVKVFYK